MLKIFFPLICCKSIMMKSVAINGFSDVVLLPHPDKSYIMQIFENLLMPILCSIKNKVKHDINKKISIISFAWSTKKKKNFHNIKYLPHALWKYWRVAVANYKARQTSAAAKNKKSFAKNFLDIIIFAILLSKLQQYEKMRCYGWG